ncbi:lysozyme inhibitor LprI family protein [Acinetobacter stercoris]|uniref:Lysozyme inhibitor LprI-like N-terminal domain-containing protein n=1 Tax=Acinetobacter stercoris TaxID=2126983 RepID=A0A2U3MXW3_9GAMM|nr:MULTISPECIES: lysozyme inhibitor LprI family protein [Acinetobacter]SPL70267.1 hypothetical protein KPC_1445 [Acinetobacter stercoris]
MNKPYLKSILISSALIATNLYAETPDIYDRCVNQTIQEMNLAGINNMVVDACSNQAKSVYEKQIVKLLDKIRKQSQQYKQPERYEAIMKSQRLWKAYIDQECNNAGNYIGSPMYSFCPMQEYKNRVDQLNEYAN